MSCKKNVSEQMDVEDIYNQFESAYQANDLSFFDRFDDETLHYYNAFLYSIGKNRWDAALTHPRVQACPYWPWVIKNQFTIHPHEPNYIENAHYLFNACPENKRREVVTRVYRYYSSSGMQNPDDVTAFVEAHGEYLDHSLGSLGDVTVAIIKLPQ